MFIGGVREMRKLALIAILSMIMLGIGIATVYAGYAWRQQYEWACNEQYEWACNGNCNGNQIQQPIQPLMKGKIRGFTIEISDEFKSKVLSITLSDSDVQKLISQGYNVTGIKPTIKMTIQGDGTITLKATGAIVTLRNGNGGFAQVNVDLEKGTVTQIIIRNITVINKTG
jgi:hypothetical protein